MKDTNVKAMVAKVMTVGLLAGAFALALPVKAGAQEWRGGRGADRRSGYYDGDRRDGGRDHWEHERQEEYERQQAYMQQQAWEQQQAWAQQQAYDQQQAYGYGNNYGRWGGRYERHEDDDDDR